MIGQTNPETSCSMDERLALYSRRRPSADSRGRVLTTGCREED
ncbi:hypothetical protein [Haloarcula halophila]|nr:hypothetical protein [Halomicroarcula sp. DFY41]